MGISFFAHPSVLGPCGADPSAGRAYLKDVQTNGTHAVGFTQCYRIVFPHGREGVAVGIVGASAPLCLPSPCVTPFTFLPVGLMCQACLYNQLIGVHMRLRPFIRPSTGTRHSCAPTACPRSQTRASRRSACVCASSRSRRT
jgi:hypothetical protein